MQRVPNAGTIRFQDRLLVPANARRQRPVGLEPTADRVGALDPGRVRLGRIDERTTTVHD